MVQRAQQSCLLTNPLNCLGSWGMSPYVVNFADDTLSSFYLDRQEDHGMTAIANGPIDDDITVLEEL